MRLVAFIDPNRCIGCAHCLKACPVDAIVGASGTMHTVLNTDCTACESCIVPCPVNCISMIEINMPERSPEELALEATRKIAKQAREQRQLKGRKAVLSDILYVDLPEHERQEKLKSIVQQALIDHKQKGDHSKTGPE